MPYAIGLAVLGPSFIPIQWILTRLQNHMGIEINIQCDYMITTLCMD